MKDSIFKLAIAFLLGCLAVSSVTALRATTPIESVTAFSGDSLVQCTGQTQKALRCARMTSDTSGS